MPPREAMPLFGAHPAATHRLLLRPHPPIGKSHTCRPQLRLRAALNRCSAPPHSPFVPQDRLLTYNKSLNDAFRRIDGSGNGFLSAQEIKAFFRDAYLGDIVNDRTCVPPPPSRSSLVPPPLPPLPLPPPARFPGWWCTSLCVPLLPTRGSLAASRRTPHCTTPHCTTSDPRDGG